MMTIGEKLTWPTHIKNITTTTSSIRARGRWSARSARSSWRSAALAGCRECGRESLLGLPITNPVLFLVGFAIVLYTMFGWWGDTIKEAHQGHHTRSSACIFATA
jgi:hypothetical protein